MSADRNDGRSVPEPIDLEGFPGQFVDVLESAARLQELVPDAVLVGGSAAALYARHRVSYDHDHTVSDLRDRFEAVFDALDRDPEFVLNRTTPGRIILGDLDGVEVGVRQLIRAQPLEVQEFGMPSGRTLRVPSAAETLRIKAYLIVKRNQVRDYIDVAALSERYGLDFAADALNRLDAFYADPTANGEPVVRDQLVRQLAAPSPKDESVTTRLSDYKGLAPRWRQWATIIEACGRLAERMQEREGGTDAPLP